jgi:hypothetical protein
MANALWLINYVNLVNSGACGLSSKQIPRRWSKYCRHCRRRLNL